MHIESETQSAKSHAPKRILNNGVIEVDQNSLLLIFTLINLNPMLIQFAHKALL